MYDRPTKLHHLFANACCASFKLWLTILLNLKTTLATAVNPINAEAIRKHLEQVAKFLCFSQQALEQLTTGVQTLCAIVLPPQAPPSVIRRSVTPRFSGGTSLRNVSSKRFSKTPLQILWHWVNNWRHMTETDNRRSNDVLHGQAYQQNYDRQDWITGVNRQTCDVVLVSNTTFNVVSELKCTISNCERNDKIRCLRLRNYFQKSNENVNDTKLMRNVNDRALPLSDLTLTLHSAATPLGMVFRQRKNKCGAYKSNGGCRGISECFHWRG